MNSASCASATISSKIKKGERQFLKRTIAERDNCQFRDPLQSENRQIENRQIEKCQIENCQIENCQIENCQIEKCQNEICQNENFI